jgi:hypothetical protein
MGGGSGCGRRSCRAWTSQAVWRGARPASMGASSPPKGGSCGRSAAAREGEHAEGGRGRERSPQGAHPRQGPTACGDAGHLDTGDGPCAPAERAAAPAPTGARRRHGRRQSGVSPVGEGQGEHADQPPQSTGAEAQETRPTERGGAALCRERAGGAALQLAGPLPASAGPSRALPLHRACFRSRRVHRHLPATILKGVHATWSENWGAGQEE